MNDDFPIQPEEKEKNPITVVDTEGNTVTGLYKGGLIISNALKSATENQAVEVGGTSQRNYKIIVKSFDELAEWAKGTQFFHCIAELSDARPFLQRIQRQYPQDYEFNFSTEDGGLRAWHLLRWMKRAYSMFTFPYAERKMVFQAARESFLLVVDGVPTEIKSMTYFPVKSKNAFTLEVDHDAEERALERERKDDRRFLDRINRQMEQDALKKENPK